MGKLALEVDSTEYILKFCMCQQFNARYTTKSMLGNPLTADVHLHPPLLSSTLSWQLCWRTGEPSIESPTEAVNQGTAIQLFECSCVDKFDSQTWCLQISLVEGHMIRSKIKTHLAGFMCFNVTRMMQCWSSALKCAHFHSCLPQTVLHYLCAYFKPTECVRTIIRCVLNLQFLLHSVGSSCEYFSMINCVINSCV